MKNSLLLLLAILCLVSCTDNSISNRVLVFSKTEGYRHASIEPGRDALVKLGGEHGFEVDTTEDASYFSTKTLKDYAVVIFLNTTGDCLDNGQQLALQRFIQAGGGFVGIHAAADTEYKWPWYGQLVGAYFNGHPSDPNVRDAEIERVDSEHASTQHLQDRWPRTDEWYNYRNIQPDLNILLNLDESTYEGGTNGDKHPIAWYHDFDGGRAFYTGGGHTASSFEEPEFLQHLLGGIQYAMGSSPLNFEAPTVSPEENRFQKIVLDDNLYEPMELEMLPDGRILFIERRGDIKLYDPETKETEIVQHFEVHHEFEDGLLGMTIDPNFEENNWVYLFYSPVGDEPKQHISRFKWTGDMLDVSTEQVIIEVPTQRDECCHAAGCLEFGPDGNLYFSTGDDTNPFASNGFSPSDERPGRSAWDAQRSSANTNDLRGNVNRIHPEPDGSYTIPDGNLFPKDGSQGRPEVYAMGCRNPFRISIDHHTGYLYWGDVGPDAGEDSITRGPRGHDEVNQARSAGFFGWPLFVADNKPYRKYDFATKTSSFTFDPEKPVNTSPNNTGMRELPPAQPAFIYYPYAESEEFPLVGTGGRNAMAGPVFYLEDYPENERRFPAYYDGKLFTYDWIRGFVMAVTMDEDGDFVSMERFMPSHTFSNPVDIIMSPQGDMYMLEYGTRWNARNRDARLVHIKYIPGNRQPVAQLQANVIEGAVPLTVQFTSDGTEDPDGDDLSYAWSFGQGEGSSREMNPSYTFENPGTFDVQLTVTDGDHLSSTQSIKIYAGNEPPQLTWNISGNRTFFFPGKTIDYSIDVEDKEDGKLGEGISADALTLSMDYLPEGQDYNLIALGHEAMAEASRIHVGKELMAESDCAACHKENEKSIGPMYTEVSQKYKDDPDAVSYLIDKIKNGGGGVWGEQAMAAHPQLDEADIEQMVGYILSLAHRKDPTSDPLQASGQYTFKDEKDVTRDGSYVLMASYTDKGAEGAEPISRAENLVLRYPQILAADYQENSVAASTEVPANRIESLGFTQNMDVLMARDSGYVGYSNIDLSGISSIGITCVSPPNFTAGGTVILHLDAPNGPQIGEINVIQRPIEAGLQQFSTGLDPVTGMHDIYLRFEGNMDRMVAMIFYVEFEGDVGAL